MLTGTAAGQLVSILLSPVLTRLYSPQQFGVLSVYTALLTILVVIASLRYELTVPMAASDEDAINLVALCCCVLAGHDAGDRRLGPSPFPKRRWSGFGRRRSIRRISIYIAGFSYSASCALADIISRSISARAAVPITPLPAPGFIKVWLDRFRKSGSASLGRVHQACSPDRSLGNPPEHSACSIGCCVAIQR